MSDATIFEMTEEELQEAFEQWKADFFSNNEEENEPA